MLISIITVTYNAEQTIDKLLQSVRPLLVKYHDVEHVLVDGASTDQTPEILGAYSRAVDRVKFVSEPDHGIYDAMNKGVRLAAGKYIIHLNGDDWVENFQAFDALYETLVREGPVVLSSPVAIYAGDQLRRMLPAKPVNGFHAKFGFHFPHQGTFFSRDVFDLVGGYNESIGYIADKIFCFRLLDTLPLTSVVFTERVVFAQAAGGVSSESSLTPLKTFVLTIQSAQQEAFKHPFLRAVFNLVFKVWLLLKSN